MTYTSRSRDPRIYQWRNTHELNAYHDNARLLQTEGPTIIWPPPKQLERVGWKEPDALFLGIFSKQNRRMHPRTHALNLETLTCIPGGMVLKRSNSDCSTHVILPEDTCRLTVDDLKRHSPHGELWLAQEYVPTLRMIGEWRVFIVNGTIIQTVHTYRNANSQGRWIAKQATSFWTLEEIR